MYNPNRIFTLIR